MTRDAHVGRLDVELERQGDAVVIRAQGEVDLTSADQLGASLRNVPEATDRVILDLLGVPFMDSSGLKVLLVACDELGERLCLVLSPGSPIVSLLDLAGVSERFSIFPTASAAVDGQLDGDR